jgi:hypothetical protein
MKSHKQALKNALILAISAPRKRQNEAMLLAYEIDEMCTPDESTEARLEVEEMLREGI